MHVYMSADVVKEPAQFYIPIFSAFILKGNAKNKNVAVDWTQGHHFPVSINSTITCIERHLMATKNAN